MGEPGRVKLGPVLSVSHLSTTESGFAAMASLGGRLFAISSSSGKVYQFDGSIWSLSADTGKSSLRSLSRHGSRVYMGSGSDGAAWWSEGTGWTAAFTAPGASAVGCMASCGVWNSTTMTTVPLLFAGVEYPNAEARLFSWDGTALTEIRGCGEPRVEAMAVYEGKLYVATSVPGSGSQGRLLCFDGSSASGEWSEVAWLSDNYVAGMAVFDGLLFCGSGLNGKVWVVDGGRMTEAYSLSTPGREYPGSLSALAVCEGRLHAPYVHPTEGVAVLSKLPTEGMGDRGWFTSSTVASTATPRAMAVYGGQLFVACEAEGAGTIFRRDTASYRGSGLLETSFFDGGQPSVPKLMQSLAVGHEKLLPGQSLELQFALEGSDTFQQVEEFEGLAGCERPLTTADWRIADSLVRLKGMPALGFAGKSRGQMAIPHVARKLSSLNPESPPASFSEELTDAEYSPVSVADGVAAVTTDQTDGAYVHQLFEFDLATLNPAGLVPRAVCYGKGNNFGSAARGVELRMWNHVTRAWDQVGSNEAAPEDSIPDRTIEATVTDFGRYAGSSGKVYLCVSSSWAGSAAIAAEVGTDHIELGALWQPFGDAVSEPMRLPVAEPVSGATLTLLSSLTPTGCGIELYLSADDGGHWETVQSGVQHVFAHAGSSLRWKARLSSGDGLNTPWIGRLKVDYFTGTWMLLGRSDTEGSTSTVLPFASGVTARQVAFRVELASPDPSGGPALTSIALQYALQPETRRRWEMEVVCEGVSGAPLRLLDGSVEVKTGRELSQALWQAHARGPCSLEDVDGASYQVWFEGMEERLSDASQERGPQTLARCRLTEC